MTIIEYVQLDIAVYLQVKFIQMKLQIALVEFVIQKLKQFTRDYREIELENDKFIRDLLFKKKYHFFLPYFIICS